MSSPQSPSARGNSPKLPREIWLEAFAFGDRGDLDACQLVSRQFEGIVAQNAYRLAVRLTCRLELGWTVVTLHASEGHVQAGPLLSIELDNDQVADYLDAVRVVDTEYGKHYFKSVFMCFGALEDELINSFREMLPGISRSHSLTIYNYTRRYGDPLRSEKLCRLLGGFDQLKSFDAICLPERFDWHILNDARLRRIPQFRACSVEDVPLRVPDGEELMEYLFDFSHVGDAEARSVHLEDCPVTDEFLVVLVQGFMRLERTLTVEVGQDPSGEPLRFDGVTEQLLGKALHSAYYYEFPGSNVRAFSRSFRFLITNCPETAENIREEYSKYGHNRLRAGD